MLGSSRPLIGGRVCEFHEETKKQAQGVLWEQGESEIARWKPPDFAKILEERLDFEDLP